MAHSVDNTPGAKGVCMRCGFKYHLHNIVKEWTSARVCRECVDPKPEETKPPKVTPEGLPKKNASPEPTDNFVTIGQNTRDAL